MFRKRRLFIILFWLILWQLIDLLCDQSILFAGPWETCVALVRHLTDPAFWQTVLLSCGRIYAGLAGGILFGIFLAVGSYRYPLLEEMIKPLMSLIKAVPVASFAVLLLIWWGAGYLSAAISMLVVLPHVYVNVLQGLKSTDEKMLEMARVLRMSAWNQSFYIYRPAVRPFWNSAISVAVGMAWKSGVAAEIIGLPDASIGEGLYMAKIYLQTADVFAWTGVTILMSMLTEKLVRWLGDMFFKWQPPCFAKQTQASIPCIYVQNVEKSYNGSEVIQDWNAVYEPGEVYFYRTPSGSGKTTKLRILAGLEKPEEGKIRFDPAPIEMPLVSMLFQEDRLCEAYSAVKNVELVTADAKAARQHLARLLPEEALDKPCCQLSGGMRRRVALVRAMMTPSQLCLLDEPFTGLDNDSRQLAVQYMEEECGGRTMIIACHNDLTFAKSMWVEG
ncbi:MAG: ATP-binding cassette domain-containing protein [Lachnospiraceae bacterium]|nr:ATP-binding cassette domain-containing protein [Lachnospiraceae bacterium]